MVLQRKTFLGCRDKIFMVAVRWATKRLGTSGCLLRFSNHQPLMPRHISRFLRIFVEKHVMITRFEDLDLSKAYTYADYLRWRFQDRVELIQGKVFKMSPAPSERHQRISSFLHGEIWAFLKGKQCQVRHAPYDVRLVIPVKTDISANRRKTARALSDQEIETVVQPDLCVICDPDKIDKRGCNGAPDLVIEILSEGNNHVDLDEKFNIYQSAGVSEYWIAYPYEQALAVYILNEDGIYQAGKPLVPGDTLHSIILKGIPIDLADVFSD
jgi:Uma2 family endonuclease